MVDLFINLDDPEQMRYIKSTIESVDQLQTLSDISKTLAHKIHYKEIDDDNAEEIKGAIASRQQELINEIRYRRSNHQKRKSLVHTPTTSVSNRVGTASLIFLVTNVAITTVMYTLLIISQFLNK